MSRYAHLQVRFPDGTIRHGNYFPNSDLASPHLYATAGVASTLQYVDPQLDDCDMHGEPYEVDIFCDYGGGFTWRGLATENRIIRGTEPTWGQLTDGVPTWAVSC